ncbi:hypothetical protein [Burkholderia cepacia]|uniref:Ankyrin repeat domain-containing protein n=1 Tax=Burkholderia cepacia TaxID=292 RepID=A0AAX2RQT1_BURCE|nr:hypothetical protein [Burkholderia cepacia]TET01581.1 hypothetical protein E3D36_16210 [Burkholderia cepacia]TEU47593.1 hypothetical protein E3D37_16445 [Burkholderia cepacia]TEU53465.1 hypothetical protein E3D38_12030 [Burkholderia cepacia]TEV02071.1 hypothetical protein E3D40_12960 [Burkholderia cepacia]TEV07882.1 hypothetical protein E3D44_18960 [Burkholderia cepacia]
MKETLSATKLATMCNASTGDVQKALVYLGYMENRRGLHFFTQLGRRVGGEYRKNHPGASESDGFMAWPVDLVPVLSRVISGIGFAEADPVTSLFADEPNRAVPLPLMKWATEEWVSTFFVRSGLGPSAMLEMDPNRPISELGSRMLHLAAMSPARPSTAVTTHVMRYLLVERGADPNVRDNCGRTPLTLFVTQAGRLWSSNDDYGYDVLSLLFDYGADANVLFTPDFIHIAECENWSLAHHLTDDYHGRGWPMPRRMRELLESRIDWTLRDSAGRTTQRRQLQLAI